MMYALNRRALRPLALMSTVLAAMLLMAFSTSNVSAQDAVTGGAVDGVVQPVGQTPKVTPGPATLAAPPTSDTTSPAAPATNTKVENSGPVKVVTGVFVNDIHELDFATHSYTADFYVWFRWRDGANNPSKSMEFMNRVLPADHQRDELLDEPKVMADGQHYAIVRQQGRFSTKLDLKDYPYDSQVLQIIFEDTMAGSASQIYVPDDTPITVSKEITVPGFKIGKSRLVISDHLYPTNFGDTEVVDNEHYSRATIEIPVTRPMLPVTIKTFLPILMVVLCAGLVFFISPAHVEGRIGLGITALLTLVALQLTASAALPDVDYLMLIDKAYLASYAFIIAALARVVFTSWVKDDDAAGIDKIMRADRVCAAVLVAMYFSVLALTALPKIVSLIGLL